MNVEIAEFLEYNFFKKFSEAQNVLHMCPDHIRRLPAEIYMNVFRPDLFENFKNVLIFLELKSILIMNVETAIF